MKQHNVTAFTRKELMQIDKQMKEIDKMLQQEQDYHKNKKLLKIKMHNRELSTFAKN